MTQASPGHSVIGMTTHRMQGRAGVEPNARLTAMTGVVLLVLFIAEIATVLIGARSILTLHVALGLLLVPPVLLKIASTTWRMAAYYRGNAAYREKGPPALALRILGPFLVFLTMLLFLSGIGLIVGLRPLHGSFLIIHKASFYLWLLALVIHLTAHSKNVIHLAGKDIMRRTRIRTTGSGYRLLTLTSSLLFGGALAFALAHRAETYLHLYPHK
jgi:hypothetical protein